MTEKPLTSMKENAVQMYIDIFINDYHDCLKFHLWSFFLIMTYNDSDYIYIYIFGWWFQTHIFFCFYQSHTDWDLVCIPYSEGQAIFQDD